MDELTTQVGRRRARAHLPLLGRVVIALALVGLVPFVVSTYQIRFGRETMIEQVQKTHLVSVLATAQRVSAYLELLRSVATSTVANPGFYSDPSSPAAQELLTGILLAQPEIIAAGVYRQPNDPDAQVPPIPQLVQLARDSGYTRAIDEALSVLDSRPLATVPAAGETWMRFRMPVAQSELFLLLLASTARLDDMIEASELGDQVEMALIDRNHEVVRGAFDDVDTLPPEVQELATRVPSGADNHRQANGRRMVSAFAAVPQSPWTVLSRQPARVAEEAAAHQRTIARRAFVLVLLITGLIALWSHRAIVLPIRRLVRAQQRLAGVGTGTVAGGEIEALEQSFAQLERNLHDRDKLGEVFLGRYQVVSVLGVGAMGTVFRGLDPRLERAVALKTVKIGKSNFSDSTELASSLVKEAVTLARVNHPNIVTVYDVESVGDQAYLAMELVEGVSLERYLWQEKKLPISQVIALGLSLFQALRAAHKHQIVHQDVKPANILLGNDGSVKVTDFGISEVVNQASRRSGTVVGTPGYLPPESLRGEGYDERGDLFAGGVVLYQCLTGMRPFDGRNPREVLVATMSGQAVVPVKLRPATPPALDRLLMALLAREPESRPASAGEVLRSLEAITTDELPLWAPRPFEDGKGKKTPDEEDRPRTVLLATRRSATVR